MTLESAYATNLLRAVQAGLYEAMTESRLAQYNLYAMRDTSAYADIEGVYVLLTEINPRIESAYAAISEALKEANNV